MVGGMMLEDLMHLTASLDLRAQSERCVSTIIFDACASSGLAGGGVGGGYLWARTSGEGATRPHRSVDEGPSATYMHMHMQMHMCMCMLMCMHMYNM